MREFVTPQAYPLWMVDSDTGDLYAVVAWRTTTDGPDEPPFSTALCQYVQNGNRGPDALAVALREVGEGTDMATFHSLEQAESFARVASQRHDEERSA